MSKKIYRPELDGLRAFAVVAVIINHINKDILPGGYLGVDIFFVISGYVITASLFAKKSKNFWDFLAAFYTRRIKRLLPALIFFVVIISIFMFLFIPDPRENGILRTGLTSLFGLSNLYLVKISSNYFSQASELNMFTHTWSLGVEEQFYFIFPLLFWFAVFFFKKGKPAKNLFFIILFLTIISFSFFIFLYQKNQNITYFLMPTRFWEISSGTLLFLIQDKSFYFIKQLKKVPSIYLLVLILVIMFLPIPFNIVPTFLIVFFTSLLILNLQSDSYLLKLFCNKNITYIGKISYSLYLWHWGVLSISLWTIGINWITLPFQILLMFLLAVFSYKFIETPMRHKQWSLQNWKTLLKSFFALIFTSFILINISEKLKGKFYLGKIENNFIGESHHDIAIDSQLCLYSDNEPLPKIKEVFEKCFAIKEDNKRNLFFLGDSHSLAFWPGANLIAEKTNSNLFAFSVTGSTFPEMKYFSEKNTIIKKINLIKDIKNEIISKVNQGDILFISIRMPYQFIEKWYEQIDDFHFLKNDVLLEDKNSYKRHFAEWLNSINQLTKILSSKNVKVILFNPTPEFPQVLNKFRDVRLCRVHNSQWFNQFGREDCSFSYPLNYLTSSSGKYFEIIKEIELLSKDNKNMYIFNTLEVLCPGSKCHYIMDGKPIYKDDDHITSFTATNLLVPKLLEFIEAQNIIIKD